MNTGRRNFLKKAAVTVPGLSLIGTSYGIPATGSLSESEQVIADRKLDKGWLNARDCGASGSTFQTTAVTKNGSKQITVADVGDFRVGHGKAPGWQVVGPASAGRGMAGLGWG